jgi:hypothetical protein
MVSYKWLEASRRLILGSEPSGARDRLPNGGFPRAMTMSWPQARHDGDLRHLSFPVLTAVTGNNICVFWDVGQCISKSTNVSDRHVAALYSVEEPRRKLASVSKQDVRGYMASVRMRARVWRCEDTQHLVDTALRKQTKQTPWPVVRKRTIPTDRPPLIDEI